MSKEFHGILFIVVATVRGELQDKMQTVNSETLLIVNSILFRLRLINISRTSCSLIFTLKRFAREAQEMKAGKGKCTGVSAFPLLYIFNNHEMKNKKRTKFCFSEEASECSFHFNFIYVYGKAVNCVYVLRQKINRNRLRVFGTVPTENSFFFLLFSFDFWVGKKRKKVFLLSHVIG